MSRVRGIVNDKHYQLVRQQYRRRDSTKLLRTIMTIAQEIGLERALSLLE